MSATSRQTRRRMVRHRPANKRPSNYMRHSSCSGSISRGLGFSRRVARPSRKLGERRIRPARSTRQRGRERRHGGAAVPVEHPQIDVPSGAAGRAARPQEPIAGSDGGADGRREQHRHPLGLRRARRVSLPRTRGDTASSAAGANASVAFFLLATNVHRTGPVPRAILTR